MRKVFSIIIATLFFSILYSEVDEKVKLPLDSWEKMRKTIHTASEEKDPVFTYTAIKRSVNGVFQKGLFHGTLRARFKVIDGKQHLRIPVIDGNASLGKVLLNGKRTSLLREGSMFFLGVDKPGVYEAVVEFFWGREQDRFDRKLQFRLPEAGVTEISVVVPEKDIDAKLSKGVILSRSSHHKGTVLKGFLDASGMMDLAWTRKVTHEARGDTKIEAQLSTLFILQEAVITGHTAFDVHIVEGETDVVNLTLPKGLEVVKVEGDAVLQWRTDSGANSRLKVLLRYLIKDRAKIKVFFQFPVGKENSVKLLMPLPEKGVVMSGNAGIQGPAGLNVTVSEIRGAKELELRNLPDSLTMQTKAPLLHGFDFTSQNPEITIGVKKHKEVKLISTLIDDLQASTVVIEDGLEITKMKLRIRNNNRQYLKLKLPKKAKLTQSLIDGSPVRPALTEENGEKILLFPLKQSEHIGKSNGRFHKVTPGETLSDIANFYYSDPNQWRYILKSNPNSLYSASYLREGMSLSIPIKEGVKVKESSFLIELVYKIRKGNSLSFAGSYDLSLPKMDINVMKATWYLYFPRNYDVLSFNTNLNQLSHIRYDSFRRFIYFFKNAMWRKAWAGGRKYKSILSQRKEIYKADSANRFQGKTVLSTFPLVGKQYRFNRNLLKHEKAEISLFYVPKSSAGPLRWLTLILSFLITLSVISGKRSRKKWIAAGVLLILFLFIAHYFNGMNRRVVWGIDLALIFSILRGGLKPFIKNIRDITESPWTIFKVFTFSYLFVAVGISMFLWFILTFPMLLSLTFMAVFFFWRIKVLNASAKNIAVILIPLFLFGIYGGTLSAEDFEEGLVDDLAEAAIEKNAEEQFKKIMQPQNVVRKQKRRIIDFEDMLLGNSNELEKDSTKKIIPGSLEISLEHFEKMTEKIRDINENMNRIPGPAVVLGASEYKGRAIKGALSLELSLKVTLGRENEWKTVPVAGDNVVIVNASVGGKEIALSRRNSYHVWMTKETGEVTINAEILVPSHGPEGSIEYDFLIARTPVTKFSCIFPVKGLEPRLTAVL